MEERYVKVTRTPEDTAKIEAVGFDVEDLTIAASYLVEAYLQETGMDYDRCMSAFPRIVRRSHEPLPVEMR